MADAKKAELDQLKKKLWSQLHELNDMFKRGEASLSDVMQIYPEELESMYAAALNLLAKKKDKEAGTVLGNLCMLQPYDARYWRTFGLALMRIKRPSLAMAAWQMALCIDEKDIPTLTYRGEQFILLGKKVDAANDLNAVLAQAKEASRHDQPFVQRAKGLLKFAQAGVN